MGDYYHTCEKCGEVYRLNDGCEPGRYCDPCAQSLVVKLERELKDEKELHIMQLAGISTASIQNTETSARDRIDKASPYWTQAYQDVCVAVDREMKLRKELEELKQRTATWETAPGNAVTIAIERIQHQRDRWKAVAEELAVCLESWLKWSKEYRDTNGESLTCNTIPDEQALAHFRELKGLSSGPPATPSAAGQT